MSVKEKNDQMKTTGMEQSALKQVVQVKFVMGYKGGLRNNVFLHHEPNKIIYPAGNNIVIYDLENRQQNITAGLVGTRGITSMAQTPSRKHLAWAEENDPSGVVTVLDLSTNKKKGMTYGEKALRYVSMVFTRDEKSLVTLSGEIGEQTVVVWEWAKQRPVLVQQIACAGLIHSVFLNPKEDESFCFMGINYFKCYKMIGEQLKNREVKETPTTKKDSKDYIECPQYVTHCLRQEESLILGTAQGELLYFNLNCEYKQQLSSSPFDGRSIEALVPYSKGFIVGTTNCTVYLYERNEGDPKKPYLRSDKKFVHPALKSKVTSLLLTQNEENLIIGLEDGQLLQVAFSLEREVLSEEKQSSQPALEHSSRVFHEVVQNFHTSTITGLDVCIRKSLVATCSLDRTVKVWDYMEQKLEINQVFEEQAYSVAFHPSGQHLVVGFRDKVRLLNVMEHSLECFRELPYKQVGEIVFSHGGQYFAIANVNIVNVFHFYTMECPGNFVFRGHSGRVNSIHWLPDDSGFYSASVDGVVNEFVLNNSSLRNQLFSENSLQPSSLAMVRAGQDYKLYVSGNYPGVQDNTQKMVYEINYQKTKPLQREAINPPESKTEVQKVNKILTDVSVSQVLVSENKELFLMGTRDGSSGSVRISAYPLQQEGVVELQMHSAPISRLAITHDHKYLFSAGEDGVLVIYELKDRAGIKKEQQQPMPFSEEFFVQRSKYYQQVHLIEKLQREQHEFKIKNKISENLALQDKNQAVIKLQIDQKKETDDLTEKFGRLQEQRQEMNQEFERKKIEMKDKHEEEKKNLENEYKVKIQMEENRFQELQRTKVKEQENYKKFVEDYDAINKEQLILLNQKYEEKLCQEKQIKETADRELANIKAEYEQTRQELEDEAEDNINRLKEKNDDELKKIESQLENAEVQKKGKITKYDEQSLRLETLKVSQNDKLQNINSLEQQFKKLTKDKESKIKEIDERDKTIQDKLRRIFDLQRKTQELEKFKFVLDYKIKELKREIGPREEEIAKMKEQISNMNFEVQHFTNTNKHMQLIVSEQHLKQRGMNNEIQSLNVILNKDKDYIRQFESDVNELRGVTHNFKELKNKMLNLYKTYVQQDENKVEVGTDKQEDLKIQREHLESAIIGLKKKFNDNKSTHEQENKRIMKENVVLIREINDLKREIKMQQQEENKKSTEQSKNKFKKPNQTQLQQELTQLDTQINDNQTRIADLKRQLEEKEKEKAQQSQRRSVNSGIILDPLTK